MQEPINNQSMLKVGTILRGIYRIDSYLSSGGFGNTYVATNIEFDERVAIKEFFMKGVTQRDGNETTVSVSNAENQDSFLEQREKFKKEARRLRRLNNPHIVSVHDLFEEHGTAYYVMDYVDGENLAERLKRTGKPMTEAEVNEILPQILDALKSVHDAGIWHLDLKPANIMVDKSGQVKLIDFGASKQLHAQKGGATTSTAISYTNGYAPREQMEQNYDKFGPWTDIYALGATLYTLLTKNHPPLPTDIDDDTSEDKHIALPFPQSVNEDIKRRILWMMKTNRMQRPQNINALFEKKHHNSDISTKNSINDIEETILEKTLNYEKISQYRQAAEQGNADAQYNIGLCLYNGDGVSQDYKEAIRWFRKAAGQGCADAQYKLGCCYDNGFGVNQDRRVADWWFWTAAKQGCADAQYKVGVYYDNCQDCYEAAKWYRKAAEQEHADALYSLGECYYWGYGVSQDYNEAVKWYKKAAEQGHADAQCDLGYCYENGTGFTHQDYIEAVKWYRTAAKQGNARAQCNLGVCYENGTGVTEDYIEAIKWYRKAAEQGNACAQYNLGFCYKKGNGVKKDYGEAIKWYQKAAEQGDEYAIEECNSFRALIWKTFKC